MKTVKRSKLSNLRMAAGNEKRITRVIDENGNLKNWVGIGWVDEGKASKEDYEKYPTMIDG